MLTTGSHGDAKKKAVQAQVIEAMCEQGYSLNTVNNYDENLLHVSAANGCTEIVREILDREDNCRVVDRKNKFGWTALMQAIRNGNVDTVRLLLEKNASIDELTYLGMPVLGLAAAIGKEMFETVYNTYPDALANVANDDINPLCVAAMRNDKQLFFRLLELGIPLSTANEYTHIMMRNSTVPEIVALARADFASDDYWNDTSDNIQVLSDENDRDDTALLKNKNGKRGPAWPQLSSTKVIDQRDLISPNLTHDYKNVFASLSNVRRFTETDLAERRQDPFSENKEPDEKASTESNLGRCDVTTGEYELKQPPVVLQRLQSIRPADLDIRNLLDDPNVTLGFTPEFSPPQSSHVPPDVNEENVFGENTPTPPHCKTPPKGMLLNWQQSKMVMILRRFGLGQHIPVFLEQEVDIDLFLTLTDSDLMEIGVEHRRDRCVLLEVIEECKRCKTY